MTTAFSTAVVVDADVLMRVRDDGIVTIICEALQLESGVIPAQEIRVDFIDLVRALTTARELLKEELGHDPFDRPEDRKVNSDT